MMMRPVSLFLRRRAHIKVVYLSKRGLCLVTEKQSAEVHVRHLIDDIVGCMYLPSSALG